MSAGVGLGDFGAIGDFGAGCLGAGGGFVEVGLAPRDFITSSRMVSQRTTRS
jgi:hypothetical protein